MSGSAPPGGNTQSPRCIQCGEWLRMAFRRGEELGGRHMEGGLPVLACPECSLVVIPDHVMDAARGAERRGRDPFAPRHFALCEGVGFRYSSVDWDVLPRLRQSVHDPDGHYAPVFFDRRALLKYVIRPEYAVRRHKDGGIVRFANGADLKYGITRTGRMVCWLGELDRIPEEEQHYLLSDNLESDHDVASWLYRDRLGMPPEPPAERQLAEAFLRTARLTREELKCEVWNLHDREIRALHAMERPVVWNEYVSHAINGLNKVLIEPIDHDLLVARMKERGTTPKKENSKIQCLEDIIESRFGADDGLDFGPFRTLRDWRNSLDHVSPGMRDRVPDWRRMRLAPPNHRYERAYDDMLAGLIVAFRRIAEKMEPAPPALPERGQGHAWPVAPGA
ncbi:MAG: hypothetical protein EB824_05145 [Thaumarchaeota archaeon S15]|nr:MAG: hypothetical protein EB824_05145 [Thaumarchaeota archaeon S15]